MTKHILSLVLCVGFALCVWGQDTDLLLNSNVYHYIDRLDIRNYTGEVVQTDIKPYSRNYAAAVFAKVDTSKMKPNELRWHRRMRMLVDDTYANQYDANGVLKYFYGNGRDFYHYENDKLQLFVNPILHTSVGMDMHNYGGTRENLSMYTNTRGFSVRGSFLGKIGFLTEVSDNQISFPRFVIKRYNQTDVLYGETYIKKFKENGLDFFSSRAYITYSPFKEMRIKFGKDKMFWGNGYQSLMLSDYATEYLMLNIVTKIWKLEYVNNFTQMIDFIPNKPDDIGNFPRKYGVFHQLSYQPTRNLSVGIFESVVFAANQPNGIRGFELHYLNPVIFYRSVEQVIGSPDNAFLGMTAKYNFLDHFQAYGQFLLDDYNIGMRNQGSNFWANKFGYQAGLKYIDVANIPTLDLQVEYNRVRPYMYQHYNLASNYAHYGQYLGHTYGGNVSDFNVMLRYNPVPSLNVYLQYSTITKGRNDATNNINYGGDINTSYNYNRPSDFDVYTGQGLRLNVNTIYGRIAWQLFNTDIYLEAEGRYRTENLATSVSGLIGLRANIPNRSPKY